MAPLRIGVLGYGYISKIHIKNIFKFSNIVLTSIFSRTNKSDEFFKNKSISFYTDYKKMILNENLDAVIIATPTYTHKDIACYCIERGINIFLEKPMALNLKECNEILDSVKEYNILLFNAHVLRFWPTYGSVKKYLKSANSKLKDFRYIEGKRIGTFPWSEWFADQSKSGGVILDLAIHDIDYALWILGTPISVECKAKKILKYEKKVYGVSNITINFKDKKIAKCKASWSKPSDFQFYTYAKISNNQKYLEFNGEKIFNNDFWKIKNIFPSDDGYFNEMKHFFDVIRGKKGKFCISGEDGKNAVKICNAAIKSADNRSKEIDLKELE
ncbi:MAG: Gfo/Idh/MocA family protein [Promethearchaeota archaeon]